MKMEEKIDDKTLQEIKLIERITTQLKGWISRFNKIPKVLRYIAIVLMAYVPGVFVALLGGVFNSQGLQESEIYFINDFSFHYSYLIAVPLSFLIMPLVYRNMDSFLNDLQACSIIDEDISNSKWMRIWGSYSFQLLIGSVVGLVVCISVCFLTYFSMLSDDRGEFLWHFPREGSYLPFIYYLAIDSIVFSIFAIFYVRYMFVIYASRKGVQATAELPTWVAISQGSADKLFRSVFILFLPVSTVYIAIIIYRWIYEVGPLDFGLRFSILLLVVFVFVLIFPVVFCGIPHKLSLQRRQLLRKIDKRIYERIKKIDDEAEDHCENGNLKELETLIKEKELVRKNYPWWPLGSITRMLSAVPITASVVPSVIALVRILISISDK